MSITGRSSNLEPMRVQLWPQQWGCGGVGGGVWLSMPLIPTPSLFDLAVGLAVHLRTMLITWMGGTARGHSED